ncbi:MAG: PTS ascorbate transporter subunit IIC [Erysipelotrichaceae bacterium]
MAKKQVPLRISEKLFNDIASWAEDDFRSINGQIEYILSECVKQRRRNGGYVGKDIDKPLDVDVKEFDKDGRD